jgi:hypothetical protein
MLQDKIKDFGSKLVLSARPAKTTKETPQTLAHILGSCAIERGISSEDPRNSVTWRHNEILKKVADSLNNELDSSYKVMVDLPGHRLHHDSFPSQWLISTRT